MNQQERLDLKKLMKHNDYEDNTKGIRKLKHSDLIMTDIMKLEDLKKELVIVKSKDFEKFNFICKEKCSFLYNSYTDIYNRCIKDELDLGLMTQALVTLKKIENNEIDQQEGSVIMGKVLHRVFVESALKRQEHLESENKEDNVPKNEGKSMSWKEYKMSVQK